MVFLYGRSHPLSFMLSISKYFSGCANTLCWQRGEIMHYRNDPIELNVDEKSQVLQRIFICLKNENAERHRTQKKNTHTHSDWPLKQWIVAFICKFLSFFSISIFTSSFVFISHLACHCFQQYYSPATVVRYCILASNENKPEKCILKKKLK